MARRNRRLGDPPSETGHGYTVVKLLKGIRTEDRRLVKPHEKKVYLIPKDAKSPSDAIEITVARGGPFSAYIGTAAPKNIVIIRGTLVEAEGGLAAFIKKGVHRTFKTQKPGENGA